MRDWLHDVNPVLTKHAATLEAVGVENTGLLRGLGEDGKRTIVRALADAGAEKVHIKTILAALDDVPEQKHDATSRPRMWHPRLALRPTDEIEWRRDIMPDDQQPSNHPQGKLQDQGRPLNATEAMLGNAGRKWAGATGADALLREKENWVHEPERKNPSFLASAVGCCAGSRDDSDDDDDTDVLAEVRSPGYACCAGGRRDFDDDTYPPPRPRDRRVRRPPSWVLGAAPPHPLQQPFGVARMRPRTFRRSRKFRRRSCIRPCPAVTAPSGTL